MRILKILVVCFMAVGATYLGLVVLLTTAWSVHRYIEAGPVGRHIEPLILGRPFGERVSLIPGPFEVGMEKTDVLATLSAGGFERWVHNTMESFHNGPEQGLAPQFMNGTQSFRGGIFESGGMIYQRTWSSLVCLNHQFVAVQFDEREQLVRAEAEVRLGSCL